MPAAVLIRRTAAAILGLLALGAVSLLPWWQQWVDVGGPVTRTSWNLWQASGIASAAILLAAVALLADLWVSSGLVDTSGPMLVPMDGALHQGLGYPAYLGLAVALAVAVLLTVQVLHRPAVAPAGPVAESGGPAAG